MKIVPEVYKLNSHKIEGTNLLRLDILPKFAFVIPISKTQIHIICGKSELTLITEILKQYPIDWKSMKIETKNYLVLIDGQHIF